MFVRSWDLAALRLGLGFSSKPSSRNNFVGIAVSSEALAAFLAWTGSGVENGLEDSKEVNLEIGLASSGYNLVSSIRSDIVGVRYGADNLCFVLCSTDTV